MINSLTIAIPLFNEEEGIPVLQKKILELLDELKSVKIINLLLVNDGSTDGTGVQLKKNFGNLTNAKIVEHKKNLNLNGFLTTSISECNTDYIVYLDSDCTFEPKYIVDMINLLLDKNVDIVNGSPYHPKGEVLGVKKGRLLISYAANKLYGLMLSKNIYTYTSIFKLYKTSLIKNIKIETKGFVSVTELFVKSIMLKAKVAELPCELKLRVHGDSKINILNSIIHHLKFMVYILFKKV